MDTPKKPSGDVSKTPKIAGNGDQKEPFRRDPFTDTRRSQGVMQCPFHGENITMILRHADVRAAAADIETYSSNAPFRVPIPSEEAVRTIRQLPIEADPPDHAEYRAITEPFFLRAKKPEVIEQVKRMVDTAVTAVLTGDPIEAVSQLALPIQSRGLTYLLNMSESEADVWIDWGIHVFKVTGGEFKTGNVLEDYLNRQLDRAEAKPGDDFFSGLTRARFKDRPLTRDECLGFGNLAFAGGRDTIIHTITSILAYLGNHPDALQSLREDPRRITLASEEFFRVFMPLTQIGRVCPSGADVHGVSVPNDHRIGLCWASANHDETVFDQPDKIQLDRRPNPHVSFGFRNHLCQGAPHARLVIRALLESICKYVANVEILDAIEQVEHEETFTRVVGYEELRVRLSHLGTSESA